MRLVLAIISFVLAAGMIAVGIAQRTIFAGPDAATLSTSATAEAPVTVIDGSALNAFRGTQSVTISGSDSVFGASGRTTDVLGWVGDASYNRVSLDTETGELVTTLVSGADPEVPNPAGSDLWLEQYDSKGALALQVNIPAEFSLVTVSDGTKPAPDAVRVSWPLDNSTPWSGPLIVAGAAALLIGLIFLLWAVAHMRRSRGPRRKQLKMPKVPKKRGYRSPRPKAPVSSGGRRAVGRGMMVAPLALVGILVLGGCSTGAPAPDFAAPTETSTARSTTPAAAGPPAATESQVKRIVQDVSDVAAEADAKRDSGALEARFGGAALELRTANYAIVKADPSIEALPAVPAGPVKLILPQQTDSWPRTVFAVVQDDSDETIPSIAMYLEQVDARSPYKAMYVMTLEPSKTIPNVAQANVGAARLLPENSLLRTTPTDLALNYADILENDVDSDFYLDFEAEGDSLRESVGPDFKAKQRADLATTASLSFGHSIGDADPITLVTNDAGALIAVNLNETTTVTPTEEGAAVNPSGQVKALSGLSVSSTGVEATYGDQLLFYMPPAGDNGKIVLLGYAVGLVAAGEI